MGSSDYNSFNSLPLIRPIKRKVFVSYHHANDQFWYNDFSQYFDDQLDLFSDNSLDREIDSTDTTYLNRTIREQHIRGTSVTIVLLGTETWKRRWIDWEIHATLEDQHALLGIVLPAPFHSVNAFGQILVPDRFVDNLNTGYAHLIDWTNDATVLLRAIEQAKIQSEDTWRIVNTQQKLLRSHS